ncbi:MAG: hypothetical protein E7382_04540 [Clostridiales bacterium]|nr:hypothetical protein [Clostridiales bacterium]
MIKRIISTLFKAIYSVISIFNLQLALLVLVVGLVVYLTGAMNNPTVKLIFDGAFILSVVFAILLTIKKLLGIGKSPKKSKGVQVVNTEQTVQQAQPVQPVVATPIIQSQTVAPETPVYYRVKGNDNYVMAEYSDKYELFLITDGGLKKVRTDFKN